MIAATAAKPAAHDVELTWEASFAQFAPQLRDVAAALLEPLIEVVGIRIDDAGPRTPLRFREGIRSEELAYGAVIEIQLPADCGMRGSCLASRCTSSYRLKRRTRFFCWARNSQGGTEG
jgi:hypothetical protein